MTIDEHQYRLDERSHEDRKAFLANANAFISVSESNTIEKRHIAVTESNTTERKRCFWCNPKNPVYIAYHDNEWGVPCHDEQVLYELFILETFQAGLSWECILNKRENFRRAYDGFDLGKVCGYDEVKVGELMQDTGIIRNRAKIKASIVNSRIYRDIVAECGGFEAYLRGFAGEKIIREPDVSITTSPISDAIADDLRKRGMRFVGSTTIYAFLQAIGIINGHQEDCFCAMRSELRK